MATGRHLPVPRRPFSGIHVALSEHPPLSGPSVAPATLVQEVADRLVQAQGMPSQGAAVVVGLSQYFSLNDARMFHETLFRAVWGEVQHRCSHAEETGPVKQYRIKTNITSDGAIPPELYGSTWSFKQLHIDRDALFFSHLYGPASGFSGGELLLLDIRVYMLRHALRFSDVFTWSDEPTEGSKPVLRSEHQDAAMAESGINLGALGADDVLFVNNSPHAGILHGVMPVVIKEPDRFVREFHRCSVKEIDGS
ncbi:hypothetical protein [Streptomyces sp. SPB162]|uniref:hypothetical protein n=1 Tax=Streptomyces sp. SPB162 TaxID=2940560 RepID=UPI0024049AA2|nr:hypothetical protein [Streptomyces sp. SPB162]MDF9811458.1 hypothetical protein [Streptomyces sp. SPB162]